MNLSGADTKAGKLQRAGLTLLNQHADRGELPTNGRFLFYELEQRGLIVKSYGRARTPAQDLSDALTRLREIGLVPWEWIVDEGRSLSAYRYASDPLDWLKGSLERMRLDLWDGGDPPLIVTESRSLAGVLEYTVRDYLTPISALAGQGSGGLLALEIGPYLQEHPDSGVVYLGDLDLAGGDIENSARERIERFARRSVEWRRLAITPEQIPDLEAAGLEPVAKRDRRFRPVREYEAWETEALGQSLVVDLLTDELDDRLPQPLETFREYEEEARRDWATKLDRLGG